RWDWGCGCAGVPAPGAALICPTPDTMEPFDTLYKPALGGRRWLVALALLCLLGAQVSGFVHRVVHGNVTAGSKAAVGTSAWTPHDHNCQLFDALTLAGGAGATALCALPPMPIATFQVEWAIASLFIVSRFAFHPRAPPADSSTRS
ncbi:MAG: hypothetical protein KGL63_08470, partial [Betaproteobacteria bacterium]|nr:hypothetical protein [Betaproteobacteria bacterium]